MDILDTVKIRPAAASARPSAPRAAAAPAAGEMKTAPSDRRNSPSPTQRWQPATPEDALQAFKKRAGPRAKKERDQLVNRLAGLLSTLVPKTEISVFRLQPDVLLENRPAYVEFSVANRTSDAFEGTWVQARIEAPHSLEPYDAHFRFPVGDVAGDSYTSGAISFTLPRADLGNTITLEWCRQGRIPPGGEFAPTEIIASTVYTFDVAARFSVSMEGIVIRDTASHHNDTLFVAFSGTTQSQVWSYSRSLGDQNNTDQHGGLPVGLPQLGPIDALPGSTQAVFANCLIANAGHSSDEEDAKKILETISQVGAVVATTVMSIIFPVGAGVWAGLSAGIDALHRAILEWAFADCDTVVLNDGRLITSEEMFLYTHDPDDRLEDPFPPTNWLIRTRKKAGERVSDILGGGCRDSDYSTGVRLHRSAAPPPAGRDVPQHRRRRRRSGPRTAGWFRRTRARHFGHHVLVRVGQDHRGRSLQGSGRNGRPQV
jgi:hypothetical protein